ncbi:MAG: SDR family oxidoreductase [Desulfobacterium sp.]|nr:SDR family oxidoreductase [Desulfobacterium sp.]
MDRYDTRLFCHDLPTEPDRSLGTILVTGATGYIGGRLVTELMARGYRVRIMVRVRSPEHGERWPDAEIVVGDALSVPCLNDALKGVDTAFYLIHSLLLGPDDLEAVEIMAAVNFRNAAQAQGVTRIIYLGGLGDSQDALSRHLRSRNQVAAELRQGRVPVTVLRAAVIVGSGSAAYEIIKALVQDAPLVLMPAWTRTKCQPLGIRDVIKYLVGVLETPETSGRSFDIGGPDILTYGQMIRIMAEILERKQWFLPSPFQSVGFNAYLVSLITPVPATITSCLLEGIGNEVVCQDHHIRQVIHFDLVPYRDALKRALAREDLRTVTTRWSDAYPRNHSLAVKLHHLPRPPLYICSNAIPSTKPARAIFRSVCRVGGDRGWFNSNLLWKLRGMGDRIMFGVGTARGRKRSGVLRVNDVIDFWRVERITYDEHLLLRAEMQVPGFAWLEFTVKPKGMGNILTVTAYFHPRGVWGKFYWYVFLPFHHFIFNDLIEQIESVS